MKEQGFHSIDVGNTIPILSSPNLPEVCMEDYRENHRHSPTERVPATRYATGIPDFGWIRSSMGSNCEPCRNKSKSPTDSCKPDQLFTQ